MVKVNSIKHMYRWYPFGIQSTLVDGIAVIYGRGSLKSPFQQWRTRQVRSLAEGEKIVARMLEEKLSKGCIPKKAKVDYLVIE